MSIDELRKKCQHEKLKTNTGLTLLNRKYSIFITNLCIKAGINANQATVSSLILGLFGSILFCFGESWINLLAIAFLWLSLTLDQVDGELARYYKTVNLNGVYLDEIHIRKEFRGKGYGTLLLKYIEEELKKENIKKIVLDANPESIRFYKKNVFVMTNIRFGEWIRMEKVLTEKKEMVPKMW